MASFTALQIITDAGRTIGAIASGEGFNNNEQTDGLIALNKLVDGWSAIGLLIMQLAESAIGLSSQAQPYALGFRPSKIKAASCSNGTTLSAPVEVLSAEQWSQIVDESRSGKFATKLFCDYAYPNSNIFWWPTATGTLHLYYYAALAQWPDLNSTSINLAPAYARGLTLNLAVDLAEQYGRPVTQSLMAMAQSARQDLMISNARIFGDSPIPDQPMPQAPGKQTNQAA